MNRKRRQTGGSQINAVFSCTTPYQGSTFIDKFDQFIGLIHRLFPNQTIMTYFVMDVVDDQTIDQATIELMKQHDLVLVRDIDNHSDVFKTSLNTFLGIQGRMSFPQSVKFDLIISAQCSDLIGTLTVDQSGNVSPEPYESLNGLINIYQHMTEKSYFINLYYDLSSLPQTDPQYPIFVNIEETMAITTGKYIDQHIIMSRMFNLLFEHKYSRGIYQKKVGWAPQMIAHEHQQVVSQFTAKLNEVINRENAEFKSAFTLVLSSTSDLRKQVLLLLNNLLYQRLALSIYNTFHLSRDYETYATCVDITIPLFLKRAGKIIVGEYHLK